MNRPGRWCKRAAAAALLVLAGGCGVTRQQQATEQLLMSDAVDRAVARIDFRPLCGRKVYLDTSYIDPVRSVGFVNANYIIGSLRQQLVAANCRLMDKPQEAEVIVEARVGALGTDAHDVTYGLPASKALSTAASLVPNAPPLPLLPEISLARKNAQQAAAKLSVFAYERETRAPIWQSGVLVARSKATDLWVLGAGPFQKGTIYEGPQFAGDELEWPLLPGGRGDDPGLVDYRREHVFGEAAGRLAERTRSPAASQSEQPGRSSAPRRAPGGGLQRLVRRLTGRGGQATDGVGPPTARR